MVGFSFEFITVRVAGLAMPFWAKPLHKALADQRKSFHSFHQEHHHEDLCGQAA
jgi:hypothetical protein